MLHRDTRQKKAILGFLKNNHVHPTADQIYDHVRQIIPNISKGTVYRNLRVLREEGMVTELDLNGTISRFEIKKDKHYHFRCDKCGRVFDLDEPVDRSIDERVARKTGCKVMYHKMEFRGLCLECQKVSKKGRDIK